LIISSCATGHYIVKVVILLLVLADGIPGSGLSLFVIK